jgi:hypothetical protein
LSSNRFLIWGRGWDSTLSVLICPTRRQAINYPVAYPGTFIAQPILCGVLDVDQRVCYGVNGGEGFVGFGPGPTSLANAPTYFDPSTGTGQSVLAAIKACTGVVTAHHRFKFTDIEDGLSNTFMIGEKSINPDWYTTGQTLGDDQGPFVADDRDSHRAVAWDVLASNQSTGNMMPFRQDTPGADDSWAFGSAHADGAYFVLCDASVRFISYNITERVFRHLANRKDGETIDPNQF